LVEQQYGCNGAVRRRRAAALLTLGDIGPVAPAVVLTLKWDQRFESAASLVRTGISRSGAEDLPSATARRAPGVSVRTGPVRRVGARIAECRSVCRRVSASPRRPPGHQGGSGRKSRENQRHFVGAVATGVKKKPRLSTGSSSRRRGGRRSAAAAPLQ
jgi:hypothetical protein